jgi:hypothetical protein
MHALDDGIATDDELLPRGERDDGGIVTKTESFGLGCQWREIARDQGELVEPSFPLLILSHGL